MVSCDVIVGITLAIKLKMLIFTLYLPHNLQSRVLLFQKLCNKEMFSNRTYQKFRDKRLVRPGSKCLNWQRSQPISYKAKFSQRYNIYLVDLKCNITYQNIRGKLRSDRFLYPEMLKIAKKFTTYKDKLSTKSQRFFNQESFPIPYHTFHHKSLARSKS